MKFAREITSADLIKAAAGGAVGTPRPILVALVGRGVPTAPRTPVIFKFVSRTTESAFTLAEVLAALVFMAILIPVALEALSIATRAGEVAARKGEAALVAERVLNENVATTNWNKSVQSGTVRQGVREFRWSLHNDPWNEDTTQSAMRQLSVEVIYTAQGHDYSVRMSTLVDSTPPGTQSTQVQ
jgi:competence protein ComGC